MNSGDDDAKLQAVGAMGPGNVVAAAELVLNDFIGPIRVRADRDDPLEAGILAVLAGQFAGLVCHEVERIGGDSRAA